MSNFVIIAAPRTGSNLLCTLLNSHPEILCHHEVFNPSGIFTAITHRHEDFAAALGSFEDRDRDPLGFLERIWNTGRDYHSVGFKWTRGQNELVLKRVIRDARVKKIVLRRCNRVKTFVSDKIAQQTQQWEVYDRAALVHPRPLVTVDRAELLNHISVNDQFYSTILAALADARQPYVQVVYEHLFDADQQQRLLEFLGVTETRYRLTAASVKQNPTDLQNVIANFRELAASVEGTSLAAELNDRAT
jgi:LPS sulfotransferase NodH